ncbi:unnamed protein product [Leptidea sinapis]|uniref:Uncharacterized protein n=1 Tax=Leptidea sinapis TaxID=189913 RepID=A0A5E4PQ52_9NEOP|nr:unnamed protein product [Leptidea sinapis]
MNYRKREKALKPRKILNVKPSKYEASEAIHTNIKYWKELKNHEIRLLSEALPQRTFENVCDILHIRSISQEPTAHETVYEEIKQGRSKKEPFLSLRQTFKRALLIFTKNFLRSPLSLTHTPPEVFKSCQKNCQRNLNTPL